jgi:hypothetical protein
LKRSKALLRAASWQPLVKNSSQYSNAKVIRQAIFSAHLRPHRWWCRASPAFAVDKNPKSEQFYEYKKSQSLHGKVYERREWQIFANG